MIKGNYSGIVLLHKKAGVTSHSALYPIKKNVKPAKVGHTGTLDKFAEGLLVVLIGSCTRLADIFTNQSKQYIGTVTFGKTTDTLDPEGEVIGEAGIPEEEDLIKNLNQFRGNIKQSPPLYSALHVNGVRAYKLARSGSTEKLKERDIVIHSLELLSYKNGEAEIKIHCSKGTYIRSLARDIGEACGSKAYLSTLTRISVGDYLLDQAVLSDEFDAEKDIRNPVDFFMDNSDIEVITVNKVQETIIKNGGQPYDLSLPSTSCKYTALVSEENNFLAFGHRKDKKLTYKFVVAG